MTEVYLPIQGYDYKYHVSNLGNVKQGTRLMSTHTRWHYPTVSLYKNGKSKLFYVHRLVMMAFKGRCPRGKNVNHRNGNRQDNQLINLEYTTYKQNIRHAVENGLRFGQSAEQNGMAKLDWHKVRRIRKLYKLGVFQGELARIFRVTISPIRRIVRGDSWKE
jgi:hypothetical protein